MTELFTSSGNNSFSTPADAECIHFKFVKCGQISCTACKALNIEPMLVTQTMGYINSPFTCSSCLLDASLPVPHFKSTCTFSQSDFVQSASSLQQWYIRMLRHAPTTWHNSAAKAAVCTFQLHIWPSSTQQMYLRRQMGQLLQLGRFATRKNE